MENIEEEFLELPPLTEIEELKRLLNELVIGLAAKFDEKINQIEKTMEDYEKQSATLIVGFGEQAVFLEALMGQLQFATSEAQKDFHDTLNNSRKQMLNIMKDGARDLVADENEGLASAIEDVVDSKSTDTPN
jgi:hypothetical protein